MITERSKFDTLIKAFLKLRLPAYKWGCVWSGGKQIDVYSHEWNEPYFWKAEKLLLKNYRKEFLEWLDAWLKLQQ